METNLSTDFGLVDLECEESSQDINRHFGKPDLCWGKQDNLDNRCESGYKSCDEGFLSGSLCKSNSEKLSDSDENRALTRVNADKDDASTIDSIDEGIGSINLSTGILSERCRSPLNTDRSSEDIECQNRAKWFKHAFQQDDDGDT